MKIFLILLVALSSFSLFIAFDDVFAQEMSLHKQWKLFSDVDSLKCNQGHLLLQKNDGTPACVVPSTFEKLIDRGYAKYDSSIMNKRHDMMNQLLHHIISNENLMHHWNAMLQKNPNLMTQTLNDFVAHMKNNPELLKNMLGPMSSEPKLREKMIQTMKNHPVMEITLKQNSKWMDSVHEPKMSSKMGHGDDSIGRGMDMKNSSMSCGMGHGDDSGMMCPMYEKMKEKMKKSNCSWCPDYKTHSMHKSTDFENSEIMKDMMHQIWITSDMSSIHKEMLENPKHMAMMSEDLLEMMLNPVMDDFELRDKMIDLLLENQDFMNTIRHDSPTAQH